MLAPYADLLQQQAGVVRKVFPGRLCRPSLFDWACRALLLFVMVCCGRRHKLPATQGILQEYRLVFRQQCGGFNGEVGEHARHARALEGEQRLQHGGVVVQPAVSPQS